MNLPYPVLVSLTLLNESRLSMRGRLDSSSIPWRILLNTFLLPPPPYPLSFSPSLTTTVFPFDSFLSFLHSSLQPSLGVSVNTSNCCAVHSFLHSIDLSKALSINPTNHLLSTKERTR